MNFPKKLTKKIKLREENNSLRNLTETSNLIDFYSNDYLGFAKSDTIFKQTHQLLLNKNLNTNGATGSRLLSGNHPLYKDVEKLLTNYHHSESALLFNSGYTANLGFFSSIPQRNDIILYDEYIHASIRDGIQLSNAKAYKFKHNNTDNLEELIIRFKKHSETDIYVVTESVFSMDGDSPNLTKTASICKKNKVFLIVDEAHAIGVYKKGMVQNLNLEKQIFARIITFGKGLGCHGAVILGSNELTKYLINFSRSFIYTTGLSPHSIATIKIAYDFLNSKYGSNRIEQLHQNILHFKSEVKRLKLNFIESNSAIQCCIIGGNEKTRNLATELQKDGFNIKPILSPTVPKEKERLRFCIHSFNSVKEITNCLEKTLHLMNQ